MNSRALTHGVAGEPRTLSHLSSAVKHVSARVLYLMPSVWRVLEALL